MLPKFKTDIQPNLQPNGVSRFQATLDILRRWKQSTQDTFRMEKLAEEEVIVSVLRAALGGPT